MIDLHAPNPGPSDPIQGPDRPFPLPYPPTGPQWTCGMDPMPRPVEPPTPSSPNPRTPRAEQQELTE